MSSVALGTLLAIAQAIVWSTATMFLRRLSTRLDPFLVNGLRASVGLMVIVPLVFISGAQADYALITPLRLLYLAGSITIGGVFGDAIYIMSLKKLGVSRAFPITNSYPLFTVLFSYFLLGEPVGVLMLVGMALVMLGVYLVARPRGQVQTGATTAPLSPRQVWQGVLMAVGAAVTWGFSSTLLALGVRGINSIVANTVRVPFVVILSLLIGAIRGGFRDIKFDRSLLVSLLGAGILGWGIGGSLYVTSVQLAGASRASIVGATAPLFAVPLSWLTLHEQPTRHTLLGTVISVLGIVLVVL